ncbi:MAG: rhodanese-like domain-containing protein [Deltaproteobacteria bacterium]|nr:rhodanese-like domain-containing protein [Deltaproteobacteria bacterium]
MQLRHLVVPLLITVLGVVFAGSAPASEVQKAKEAVKNGARLIDVRTPEEFSAGHIKGAANIPLDAIQANPEIVGGLKDRPLVLYCRSGRRSEIAKGLLLRAGYREVLNLGAIGNW